MAGSLSLRGDRKLKLLITGSSGLIGSEAVHHYDKIGHDVIGVDNNMRREFFGDLGDTTWNLQKLKSETSKFTHYDLDIRDRARIESLFAEHRFDVVIHCAAQPSHDKAKEIPLIDFDVNAVGTVNLLEACRRHCPESPFIFMSTNKVYGDSPNELPLRELPTRWDYALPEHFHGVDEHCRIDRTLHSLFGASKAAADVMAQEYGRYFGMPVGIFRGGCLTGPGHSGVELHGFLAYLVRACVEGLSYRVFGYNAKQVRDQIHSSDVIEVFDRFIAQPRRGEVYNLGGGRENSVSMLEAIDLVQTAASSELAWTYVAEQRVGDHICYISDVRKLMCDYSGWYPAVRVPEMIEEMVVAAKQRLAVYGRSATATASAARPGPHGRRRLLPRQTPPQ